MNTLTMGLGHCNLLDMTERPRTTTNRLAPGVFTGFEGAEIVMEAEAQAERRWGRRLLDALDRSDSHPEEQSAPSVKKTLTVEEAAAQLGVGRTSCFGLIANGALRSLKVGHRRLVPADAIDQFLRGDAAG